MPVVQITYDVPLDIAKGLATGELKMLGTAAVRNSTGIAAHIREVSRTVSEGEGAISASLVKSLKDPKVVAVGLGVVAVVAAAGGAAGWIASRRKGDAGAPAPVCVEAFNTSLSAYLTAVSNGSVDADVINSLIAALDALKEDAEDGKIAVEISIEQWDALVEVVADYTNELAEANSVELESLDKSEPTDSRVIDLRRYLDAQRQIFDKSA
jgi:hypothetical protein